MELITLGGLELAGANSRRVKPLLLLVHVALEGSKDRHYLAELFWPDAADPLNSLAAALKQLRQYAPGAIEGDYTHVSSAVECDATTFLQVADAGHYEQALKLYRGPFLSGIYLPSWSVELEEWVYGTREFLAGRARNAWLRSGEDIAAKGKFGEAARCAEVAYLLLGAPELEPEEFTRVHALLAAGDSPDLGRFRKDAKDFGIELSLSPAEAQEQLWHPPGSPSLGTPRQRLPIRGTSFVGRDVELVEVANQLARPDCSLLTLTGPGGVGKSRLVVRVAHDLSERYIDNVHFVSLEALNSSSLISSSIAGTLSLGLQGGEDPLVQVTRYVGERVMLLVLDNYEHLLEGATVVTQLLHSCPNLKLLVTSRERLNLEEEWVLPLEGFVVPPETISLSSSAHHDALRLFEDRAKRARLNFALTPQELPYVVSICNQVEGMPLGIELAAAWVRVLSCKEIAQEIARTTDFLSSTSRNVPERHKSIRAVFEHSWRLLTSKEQEVLKRLSVFQGGFRREAAAEVAEATIPTLASLVDKSLLRVSGDSRYDLHPLLHQYAQEKLAEHSESWVETREKHRSYFFRFLRERNIELKGAKQKEGLLAMTEELENIRAAWQWAVEEGRLEELGAAVEPMTLFYDMQARYREGTNLLREALVRLDETNPDHQLTLGNVLTGQAFLYQWSSNYGEAVRLARHGLDLLRPLGESWGVMLGLDALGFAAVFTGDYAEGKRCWTEALAVAKARNNHLKTAELLSIVGMAECWLDDQAEAEAYLDEAMILTRHLGKHTTVIYILLNLGFIHVWSNPRKALPAFQQGLQLAHELGYRRYLPYLLYGQGWAFCGLGQYLEAQTFCQQALTVAQESGDLFAQALSLAILGRATSGLQVFAQAQDYLEQSLQLSQITQSTFAMSVTIAYLAEVWVKQGRTEQAAELLGLTLHHSASIKHTKEFTGRLIQELQDKLSPQVLIAAVERGKAMRLEEVVEEISRRP